MSLNVQAAKIAGQLQQCVAEHRTCCRFPGPASDETIPPPLPQPRSPRRFEEDHGSNFRLFDVEMGCVRRAALDERFVALSYVCGKQLSRFDRPTLETLSLPGSISRIEPLLPKTILDAVEFVRDIGERYLWVDALCLANKDKDDVERSLWISNSIWAGAHLTIVAASGHDADAGLVYDRLNTSSSLHPAEIEQALLRSPYSTRGWTLHEFALSRRLAIFIDGEVHFYCPGSEQRGQRAEIGYHKPLSLFCFIPDPLDGVTPALLSYRSLCEAYSVRKLRRDGDTLRAFVGASRVLLAGMRSTGVEGLPSSCIGYLQLFYSPQGNLRRRAEFASFSWAGWEGEILWPRREEEGHGNNPDAPGLLLWLRDKPLVDWKALRPGEDLQDLSDVDLRDGPSSPLEVFVRNLPGIFSTNQTLKKRDGKFNTTSGSESDLVSWEKEIGALKRGDNMRRPCVIEDDFPTHALDIVNSNKEFEYVLGRIAATKYERAERSWCTQRLFKHRHFETHGGLAGPLFRRDTKYRRPRQQAGSIAEETRLEADHRAAQGRKTALEQGQNGLDIPKFPPYTILYAHAITLQLILGDAPEATTNTSPAARALLGTSGQQHTVGTLLPDNASALPSSHRPTIDCIVVARAVAHMEHSVLGQRQHTATNSEMGDSTPPPLWEEDLLWVMYVEWTDGIAERRGIGQILISALADAVAPGPKLQEVLLG